MPINVTEIANKASSTFSTASANVKASIGAITANISSATANLRSTLSTNTTSSNSNLGPTKAQKETFTQGASRDILTIEKSPTALP
jgi:hypothetical protein